MAYVQGFLANRYCVAIVQPACWRERLHGWKTEHLALLGQPVNPELVAFLRADDGQLHFLCQLTCAACMVDMRMGQPDGFEREAQAFDFPADLLQIAARIDDGSLHGLVAPHQRTVLLELGDGNGVVVEHGRQR
ncbi:hypothetical protein D3C72_1913440 [compost metagenome]